MDTEAKVEKKIYLFEDMPIGKAILKLSVPCVVASLVMIIYNLSDTYFVGLLKDAVQTSGVTLAAPALLAFNVVNNLFGVGTSSKMSRLLGEKRYEKVKDASSFGFYSALISAVIFALVCTMFKGGLLNLLGTDDVTRKVTSDYLFWTVTLGAVPAILNVVLGNLVRSEGSAMHASVGTMSGCLLNIILDPFFILPQFLNMGCAGAGCATFISNCVACLYFFALLLVKRGKTFVSINIKRFKWDKEIAWDIFAVGVPASIQNLLNVTGMTILNNFTSAYSPAAVSAMGNAHKINMVPMYISMGITQGIMPLVSYTYAAHNSKRFNEAIKVSFSWALAIMIVMAGAMFVFSEGITRTFLDDAEVVAYGTRFLRANLLSLPFLTFDFGCVAIFQACGFGGKSLLFAIMRKVILEIPALFVLNKIYPLYGLAYAPLVAEFTLAIAGVFVLKSVMKKIKLTSDPARV